MKTALQTVEGKKWEEKAIQNLQEKGQNLKKVDLVWLTLMIRKEGYGK